MGQEKYSYFRRTIKIRRAWSFEITLDSFLEFMQDLGLMIAYVLFYRRGETIIRLG